MGSTYLNILKKQIFRNLLGYRSRIIKRVCLLHSLISLKFQGFTPQKKMLSFTIRRLQLIFKIKNLFLFVVVGCELRSMQIFCLLNYPTVVVFLQMDHLGTCGLSTVNPLKSIYLFFFLFPLLFLHHILIEQINLLLQTAFRFTLAIVEQTLTLEKL